MVAAVRAGASRRAVARQWGVSPGTVQLWLERAGDARLDRVDWSDRPSRPRRTSRTERGIEDRILTLRRELREESPLGEYGALAIRRELLARPDGATPVPSGRTIGRILERRGALDARRRTRRPAPPPGWYLPEVGSGRAELDSVDIIEGLRLKGGQDVDVLTVVSLHGGLPGAWPADGMRSDRVVAALAEHWGLLGLPAYAQFDNDARFSGGHRNPDTMGKVIRLCLALSVVPVFVPPRETGFQAAVEALNGRWQQKVWARRGYSGSLVDLQARSAAYIGAYRRRAIARIEAAPPRAPMPLRVEPDRPLSGRLVFVRRTSDTGSVSILNRVHHVDRQWPHRLVRAQLDIDDRRLDVYALRRREPANQPLLAQIDYDPPERWFR